MLKDERIRWNLHVRFDLQAFIISQRSSACIFIPAGSASRHGWSMLIVLRVFTRNQQRTTYIPKVCINYLEVLVRVPVHGLEVKHLICREL